MARPQHQPTETTRAKVRELSGRGLAQADIGRLVGLSVPTLHRHYRDELDSGMAEANSTVAGHLYRMAETVPAAAIFWLKCRAGWKEKAAIELTGEDGAPVAHHHTLSAESAIGALLEQLAASKATGEGQG